MNEQILVIDDEKIILDLTSMILRNKGFQVQVASTGEEGLRLAALHGPALVLLDYMMPNMNGMEVLKSLRLQSPDAYVIMFTGKGSEEIAVELMKAGASDYVLKPFNNQDLVERIENVLKLRRIELHNRELILERERLMLEIELWNQELERRVEEKSRELEQAETEKLQAEKLASLGLLSGGMAHEIRNPLNSISLFTQILRSGTCDETEKAGYADRILKEVDRIDDLLMKLLAASKRPHYELHELLLTDVIDRAVRGFEPQINAQKIVLKKEYARIPPPIVADSEELEQIFTNLVGNSLFELQHGGEISIRVDHDDDRIDIEVADSGKGIPKENLNKIFDPFFTTKARGTGFGLSVVLRIVKTYNGKINVESKVNEGTVFHIQLPLS